MFIPIIHSRLRSHHFQPRTESLYIWQHIFLCSAISMNYGNSLTPDGSEQCGFGLIHDIPATLPMSTRVILCQAHKTECSTGDGAEKLNRFVHTPFKYTDCLCVLHLEKMCSEQCVGDVLLQLDEAAFQSWLIDLYGIITLFSSVGLISTFLSLQILGAWHFH